MYTITIDNDTLHLDDILEDFRSWWIESGSNQNAYVCALRLILAEPSEWTDYRVLRQYAERETHLATWLSDKLSEIKSEWGNERVPAPLARVMRKAEQALADESNGALGRCYFDIHASLAQTRKEYVAPNI